jgi:hypothetical protein
MATEDSIKFLSANTVYQDIVKAGVNRSDAVQIATSWLQDSIWRTGRTFSYSVAFPAADPACQPQPFARSFAHQDWIDGTSTVQAGETPTEEGFNRRFHKIENDLDRLGQLNAQGFNCLNDMRASLARALEEIRLELNRLNADVAEMKRPAVPTLPPFVNLGTRPNIADSRFIGNVKIQDKAYQTWITSGGDYIHLPLQQTVDIPSITEPRSPAIAEIIAEDRRVRAAFPGQVNAKAVREKFGDLVSTDGRRLGDLLAALPPDKDFATLGEMVEGVVELDTMVMRGTGATAALREQLNAGQGAIADAPAAGVQTLTPQEEEALGKLRIGKISDLARTDAGDLATKARAAGIDISAARATALVTRAKLLQRL